jgi:hypothetical protein
MVEGMHGNAGGVPGYGCFYGQEYLCRVGCSVGSAVGAGAWALWLPVG